METVSLADNCIEFYVLVEKLKSEAVIVTRHALVLSSNQTRSIWQYVFLSLGGNICCGISCRELASVAQSDW